MYWEHALYTKYTKNTAELQFVHVEVHAVDQPTVRKYWKIASLLKHTRRQIVRKLSRLLSRSVISYRTIALYTKYGLYVVRIAEIKMNETYSKLQFGNLTYFNWEI